MEQWAPAASLEKYNSTDHRLYVPSFTLDLSSPFCLLFFFYLVLNFGLASYQCSQTPILKGLVSPSSPAGVTLKDVKYLCCPAQAAVPAPGIAGESPAPPSPCWGTSQCQHLEQPHACCLLLAPSLSTTKRWKVSPASCPQRQAIGQLVQLFTSCFLSLSLITRLFVD